MIGKVGSDIFSPRLLQDLRSAGVDTAGISNAPETSGVAVINRTACGENSIVVIPGANHALAPSDLEPYRNRIAEAGMVLTQLETPLDTLEALCKITSASGVPLMLDPAPVQPLSPEILNALAWITPNEIEAQQLTDSSVPPGSETKVYLQAESLLAMGVQNVLLKLGENGAYLASAEGHTRISPYKVHAVDTTGAGDAFNAAFATGLLRGMTPVNAGSFAAAAAAISVTRAGAHCTPSQEEIEQFLKDRTGDVTLAMTN
jgi:ribokinase